MGNATWLALSLLITAVDPSTDPGTLSLRIFEPNAERPSPPLPARVHLSGEDGKPVHAPGLPSYRDHFNCDGMVRLQLPAGRYDYTVERGPEYRRAAGIVTVLPGKDQHLEIRLTRLIDMASLGWYSGDTHVHRSPDDMPRLLESEDLHVAPVLTVWNKTNPWKAIPLPEPLLRQPEPDRAYHLLACEDERRGGALLYFNLHRPLDFSADGPETPSPITHLDRALEQDGAWVEVEKPFWWDAPTWVATEKVRSIGLANNHMCRLSMLDNEAWGRPRDRGEFPGPRGNGFYTQSLYYRLLNCGLRIPPSAGSASGVLPNPVGYNRVYVHLDGPFTHEAWWRSLGEGRSFVTNGPLLLVESGGQRPGSILRVGAGRSLSIPLDVRIASDDPIEAVEVIRDGKVVERLSGREFPGRIRLRPLTFDRSGWFLVRAVAAVPGTFRFASTAPFFVEVGTSRTSIHRDDVRFFLEWIDQRSRLLEKALDGEMSDPLKRTAVLEPHRRARQFFDRLLEEAR